MSEQTGNQANAPRDLDMGPQIRLPEEDKDERRPGGVGRTWLASRAGALRCGVPPTPPDHLPYMLLAGTNLEDKGGSLHLSQHTPFHM